MLTVNDMLVTSFAAVFCVQVMVYDEAWDTVDLEGQHDAAAAAAAAAAPTGLKAFKAKASAVLQAAKTKAAQTKGSAVFQREFWSGRRLLLVLLLLAVLALAMGLGIGLGTRHSAGALRYFHSLFSFLLKTQIGTCKQFPRGQCLSHGGVLGARHAAGVLHCYYLVDVFCFPKWPGQ
jgi:hypothetical protein